MQQGGNIHVIPSMNQLPNGNTTDAITKALMTTVADKNCLYYNGNSSAFVIQNSELKTNCSNIMEITDDEGDHKGADDVVDGDDDTESREKENEECLYSSAVINHKALYVVDPQATSVALQDFDTKQKKLIDNQAVMVTSVIKYYKKQQVDLLACSCGALRSRYVFNSSLELFCCLKDFNCLYPPCLHIRVLERIKSIISFTDLQQMSPDNCGYCAYENDKEVFCLTKLPFGQELYAISSVECTSGIVQIGCGTFKCLICKGPECQHVLCLQNHVKNMDIEAAGIPEIMKLIYVQLFSVRPEGTVINPESTETIYFHLSNGQPTVVGSSPTLEGLKLPAEKKRKKRVTQADARRFHCDNCHKSFKHKHHLREHMHLHTGEQPFECKNCGRKFSHSGSLSQHRQRSCSSGVPCQNRQRSSSSKNTVSRKSASPRSTTSENKTENEPVVENTSIASNAKVRKVVSPRSSVADVKSVTPPRSVFTDVKLSQGLSNVSKEICSPTLKSAIEQSPYRTYLSPEALTVPEPIMYKSLLQSHDTLVVVDSSDQMGNTTEANFGGADTEDNSNESNSVHNNEESFIQSPTNTVCSKENGTESTSGKGQRDSCDLICSICQKKFSSKYSLHTHQRLHTGETPYYCDICDRGFPQNIQLQLHTNSKDHITKLNESLRKMSESPVVPELSVQPEEPKTSELTFSKPVLSHMLTTPSWDIYSQKSTTSLPSISELMSSVATHSMRHMKKDPISVPSHVVVSDKALMSSKSLYSSGLQLMSSVPDELLQQNAPKELLYDQTLPLSSVPKEEVSLSQPIEQDQGESERSRVSSSSMTDPTQGSPVSTEVSVSSTEVQSQSLVPAPQSDIPQLAPRHPAPPTSYGNYKVSDTNPDSALKALCSFTEKPIPSDAAESLADVTRDDEESGNFDQKDTQRKTPPAYPYPPSWNGWNNWNGGFPLQAGAPPPLPQWNGVFGVPVISPWQGFPNYNPAGMTVPTDTTGSQGNSGIPVNTEQKNKNIPQPKPPAKPKAPYSRYSIKVWNSVKSSNPNLSVGEMNRLIGQMWRGLPEEEKNQFLEDYSADKEKYRIEYEKFRSSPEFQVWLASNIDKNSNSKKKSFEGESDLEDRQDYRQFIVKAT